MDVNKNIINSDKTIKGKVSVNNEEKERYNVKFNDLFLTRTSETSDEIGLTSAFIGKDENTVFSGFILRARPKKDNINSMFYAYYMRSNKMRNNIIKYSSITTRALINSQNLSKLKIAVPSIKEQDKIFHMLWNFDKKIEFLNNKLKIVIIFKKYLLQNLFPKSGELAPKLRFKNENGGNYSGWNEEFLGDITDICTGKKDLKDNDPNGLYPFFVRSSKIERIDTYSYDGEAILIPGDGKIGEVFHYINGKFDYHQRVYKISDFKNVNGKYIYYYLQKNFLKHALKYSAKATVDSLRLPIIKEMKIRIPQLEEQNKIAILLSTIDNRIDLIQNQINKTEEFKKGLLQQMFVEMPFIHILILISYKNCYR